VVADDDLTYVLRIRNRKGAELVTAPQALRVFTPDQPTPGDPALIYRILDRQEKRDTGVQSAVSGAANERLKAGNAGEKSGVAAAGVGAVRGGAGEVGEAPGFAAPAVLPAFPVPSATAAEIPVPPPGGINFRGVAPEQIIRVQVPEQGGQGGREVVLEYNTQRYIQKYLVHEIRGLTEQAFAAVGPGGGPFMVQARYGNHLMVVETSMEVARALRMDRIDEKQWSRQARFTLDGTPIQPALE
jgi:hypothetical protein